MVNCGLLAACVERVTSASECLATVAISAKRVPLRREPIAANGMVRPRSVPYSGRIVSGRDIELRRARCHPIRKKHAEVSAIGIDIGKNTFHLIGEDRRGKIVMRARVSRAQLMERLVNVPRCLIGMEAGAGAHHIARRLIEIGHDVQLIPARYVKPFLKGHKNDYRDAEAIIEAVQRPMMSFVAVKTAEQCDLRALHRVHSRLV